ncbi:hypothetical protein BD413DRAFT_249684 [Trametes elegans]|nr:hypothetical protein BD413DRAFT_249684 [Trametes elegans]
MRLFGLLHFSVFALLWAHGSVPDVSAKVLDYSPQGFFFDWYGDQSPPIPTAAQCDTLHITWGRRTATGPNPVAPYFLQIYTSTFIVPFVIPAGDDQALSYDWVVPFVPGTQFQMCMVASNGVSGGCQNMYTVYQRPNYTLDNPPSCFNLTYPHAPLGVKASLEDGSWSQFGWVDQCSELSLTPTNGTPPYTYSIAPALHPPFNYTSDNMDTFNWTVSLMYGMPFFVTVTDANGVGWTNGPLHPTGAGSTSCLDLNTALHGSISGRSSGVSTGGAIGIAIGTLVLGGVIGLLGTYTFFRWQRKRYSPVTPLEFQPKFTEPGGTPTLSLHPPSSASTTYGPSTSPRHQHQPSDEHGLLGAMPSPPQDATFSRMESLSDDRPPLSPSHQHSRSNASSTDPTSPTSMLSPHGPLGHASYGNSHVYVVHHDGGRPPPVTVFTSDGTEVVELPPQYETAAGSSRPPPGPGPMDSRPLPISPDGRQRRVPRILPPKPTMVTTNADPSPSPSSSS